MTIQFPANKFVNDTFDYNGLTYVWDGEKWTASGAAAFEDAYVNVTGDTMTGDLTVPSLNDGPLAGFRNQIINGDFRVWQRGTTKTFTGVAPNQYSDFYIADRWLVSFNAGAGVNATASRTSFATTGIPGAVWGINFAQPGAVGIGMNQVIEVEPSTNGVFSDGSTWTLSWWTDNSNLQPDCRWCQAATDATAPSHTISATRTLETIGSFTRYSATITISQNVRAGDLGLRVLLSDPNAAPASFSIAQVQLEPGPVATPFEHRPIGTELALCQRYYYAHNFGALDSAFSVVYKTGGSTTHCPLPISYPVTMRSTPTVDVSGMTVRASPNGSGSPNGTARNSFISARSNAVAFAGVNSSLSQNEDGVMDFSGSATFDAEL
jgi:hypothetical protein